MFYIIFLMLQSKELLIKHEGNGVTKKFTFPYLFFEDKDLKVNLVDKGVFSLLTLGGEYDVEGKEKEEGGFVIFKVAPKEGQTVMIARVLNALQLRRYIEGGDFPAKAHERAVDRLVMLIQQYDPILGVTSEGRPLENLKHVGVSEETLPLPSSSEEFTLSVSSSAWLIENQVTLFEDVGVFKVIKKNEDDKITFLYEGNDSYQEGEKSIRKGAFIVPSGVQGEKGESPITTTTQAFLVPSNSSFDSVLVKVKSTFCFTVGQILIVSKGSTFAFLRVFEIVSQTSLKLTNTHYTNRGSYSFPEGSTLALSGLKGSKGDQGVQGEVGAKGEQGIQGEKGKQGNLPVGSLLYNVWVDVLSNNGANVGFTLSNPGESDWMGVGQTLLVEDGYLFEVLTIEDNYRLRAKYLSNADGSVETKSFNIFRGKKVCPTGISGRDGVTSYSVLSSNVVVPSLGTPFGIPVERRDWAITGETLRVYANTSSFRYLGLGTNNTAWVVGIDDGSYSAGSTLIKGNTIAMVGKKGAKGDKGDSFSNSFSLLQEDFFLPKKSDNFIIKADSSWMARGLVVCIESAKLYLDVLKIISSNEIEVKWSSGYFVKGARFPVGRKISEGRGVISSL